MYNAQNLASNIKAKAKEKNILIRDMLTACDLSINTISQISDKKGLSSFSLAKIADYLDCSVDYLLGRTNNSYNKQVELNNNLSPTINSIITGNSFGNNASNVINTDSNKSEFSKQVAELIRIFKNLSVKNQIELLSTAFEMELQESKKQNS